MSGQMNDQKNKKILVMAVLMGVAGVFVVRAIFFAGPPSGNPTPGTANPAPTGAAATGAPSPTSAPAAGVAPAGTPAAPGAPSAAGGSVNLEELAKNVQVVDFQYDQTSIGRNPMAPLVGPEAVIAAAAAGAGTAEEKSVDTDLLTQQMAVTGIVWDKKFPVAVINNDVVAPGDVLASGIVVKAIEPHQVTLGVRDHVITLPLKQLEEQ